MDDILNSVGAEMPLESVQVDAVQAQDGEELSSIVEQTQEQQEAEPKDAGWFKQRISKEVSKALEENNAKWAARFEAELAPLREERLIREAQQLVDDGEFKTLERAKEYLQLKSGQPNVSRQAEQPSQEQEQPTVDPVIQAKAEMLARQAQKIKTTRGLDVMGVYNSNPQIQQQINNGELDFYDVAEMLASRKAPPSPVRSSNGARPEKVSISNMADAQWKTLNEQLAKGKKYNLRE